MSLRFLDLGIVQLLADRGELSHLLMGGSELCFQFLRSPLLFSEAVLNILLAMMEQGHLLAAVHERLRRGHKLRGAKERDEGWRHGLDAPGRPV